MRNNLSEKITRKSIDFTTTKAANKNLDKIYTFYDDILGLYSSFINPEIIVDIPFDSGLIEKVSKHSKIRNEFLLIDSIIANKSIFSAYDMNNLFNLFKKIEKDDLQCSNDEIEIINKILIRNIPYTFEHILYNIIRYNTEFGEIKEIWNLPVRNNVNIYNLRTNILSHDIYGYEIKYTLKNGEIFVFCDIEENFIDTSELASIFEKNPDIDLLDFIISIMSILSFSEKDLNRIQATMQENNLVINFNNQEMEENYIKYLLN